MGLWYPLYNFSGNFSILGRWSCWGRVPGRGSWHLAAASLTGCTVSPLCMSQHCWVLLAKASWWQQGQRFGVEKANVVLVSYAVRAGASGRCCWGSGERQCLTDICLCKSNHLSFQMFILPFPWLYFLSCHMYFLWYFSLVKLRRESLTISLGYIPNKVMFVIFTV